MNYAAAFDAITSPCNISVSGVMAGNAASVAAQSNVGSVSVSDTAANVTANIASLATLATGGHLTAISFTDNTKPSLGFTAGQATIYAAAFERITTPNYMRVYDGAAGVLANIASLQTLTTGGQLTSIILYDSARPAFALTAGQVGNDAIVLSKVVGANLVTASDTAANVVASLAALETLASAGKITSIMLTDPTTPTLTLTASQMTAYSAALNKITTPYNLALSPPIYGNDVSNVISLDVSDAMILGGPSKNAIDTAFSDTSNPVIDHTAGIGSASARHLFGTFDFNWGATEGLQVGRSAMRNKDEIVWLAQQTVRLAPADCIP